MEGRLAWQLRGRALHLLEIMGWVGDGEDEVGLSRRTMKMRKPMP